ncbi:MAG: hypothetical protein AAB507_00500 [Patescibacteria group bacterium]
MLQKRFFLFVLIFLFSFGLHTFAQTAEDVANRRAQLEGDLKSLESEIDAQRKILADKQKESVSLERDVAILDAKIKEADLSIKARNLSINKLSSEINDKQKTIGILSEKIDREKESLAQLLRKTRELDESSAIEFMLSGEKISQFFSDADAFISINSALQDSVEVVSQNKDETALEKKSLEGKKEEEVSLRKIQELQRKRIAQDKTERNNLLKITRGKESEYQKVLSAREKSAAAIRSELFVLQGSKAISFEKAYEYALLVEEKTGTRPAFLLGIITEETNLGENLGSGKWRVDMHPTRDQPVFAKITLDLGFNPDTMPVSKKAWYGWGGAMGPAQFIPSTWVCFAGYINTTTGKCSKNSDGSWQGPWEYNVKLDRIGKRTGSSPPSPWEPKDAFMAAGLLLMDNGADKKTYQAEFRAAMCYLAGCSNAKKASLQFYGRDVMEIAAKYQTQIDILQRN